jgi:hypothetical protein
MSQILFEILISSLASQKRFSSLKAKLFRLPLTFQTNIIKLYLPLDTPENKLECLSVADFISRVLFVHEKTTRTQVELTVIPANIRQGKKFLVLTIAVEHCEGVSMMKKKVLLN